MHGTHGITHPRGVGRRAGPAVRTPASAPDPRHTVHIDLSCSGCMPSALPAARAGAEVRGASGSVRWLEEGPGDFEQRPLRQAPPVIGATYLFDVRHPFRVPAGQDVWVGFTPGRPAAEGWFDHAALLPQVGIARVRPKRFMGRSSDRDPAERRRGWMVGRVEEMVFGLDLPNHLQRAPDLPLPELTHPWPDDEVHVVVHGNLVLVEHALPRGQRRRALVLQSPLALPTLLMLEEIGFHEASMRAMNRPLGGAEASRLRDPTSAFPYRWR